MPPLEKYASSTEEDTDTKTVIGFQETCSKSMDAMYVSSHVINNQIKELQVLFLCLTYFLLSYHCFYISRVNFYVYLVLSFLTSQGMNLLQLSNDVILHAAKPSLTFVFFLILKQQGGAASEMEMDRLKFDYKRSMQMFKRQKKMYEDLYQCFVNELLEEGAEAGDPNRKAA